MSGLQRTAVYSVSLQVCFQEVLFLKEMLYIDFKLFYHKVVRQVTIGTRPKHYAVYFLFFSISKVDFVANFNLIVLKMKKKKLYS